MKYLDLIKKLNKMANKEENFNIIIDNEEQEPNPNRQKLSQSIINNLFGDEYNEKNGRKNKKIF